ncbi:MAG TPA: helix-turn-helix domain-containing protein [Aldersonia sp.]
MRRPARSAAGTPAERLLATATELFAAHGIRAVGIDRILSESGVAKASLYSAFGSKDALVTAYLERLDQRDRARWTDAVAEVTDPVVRVLTFFDLAAASAPIRNFRGCQYLNAATEFPGQDLPMLAPVRAHRAWVRAVMVAALREAGCLEAEEVAQRVQVIYDGALAGSKFAQSEDAIHLGRRMAVDLIAASRQRG